MIKNFYVGYYGTAEIVESVPSDYKYFATDESTGHHIYFEPRKGYTVAVRL